MGEQRQELHPHAALRAAAKRLLEWSEGGTDFAEWDMRVEELREAVAAIPPSEGMTLAPGLAKQLGALVKEQARSRIGIYPDGNPNAAARSQGDPSGALRLEPEAAGQASLSLAARDVLAERRRQVENEGWTQEHDDEHSNDEMACAAACYALPAALRSVGASPFRGATPTFWRWAEKWWKPGDRRRELVKAGALILAEIERLDRKAEPPQAASVERGD